MAFFLLLFSVAGAATIAARAGVPGLAGRRARTRIAMSTAFMFTGTDHLVTPARYLPMLPANAPFPKAMVFFTGLCEMSGAVGLLTRRWRRPAAMMLALYLICETPANVKMAVEGVCATGMPAAPWLYRVRLCFIPVAIWWALYSGGAICSGACEHSR
jgi:uncharacterized membrane protein